MTVPRASSQESRVGVVGLGNVLMGDDAFGPYCVAVLEAAYEFPERVVLMDLGTPSLDLTTYIEDLEALIVIDSVGAKGAAGGLHTYTLEQLLRKPLGPRTNAHEPGLKEALLVAQFRGRGPREVLFVGAVPESTSTGVGLSPAVAAAVPSAVDEVLRELRRLGVAGRPRAEAAAPRVWWEQEAAAGAR